MLPRGETPAPLNALVIKELRLLGSFGFDREYEMAGHGLITGKINVGPMLSTSFAFSELQSAGAVAISTSQVSLPYG